MADPIFPFTFEAEIERFGVGRDRQVWYNVLFLPSALRARLPFDEYPRLRVEGEIADVPVENAFIPAGDGRNYVIVSPQVMKSADLTLGDRVEMRFRIADQDRVDVPQLLAERLAADAEAGACWEAITPGRKRMAAHYVGSAKSDQTRARRADEAIEAIREFRGDLRAWNMARRGKAG